MNGLDNIIVQSGPTDWDWTFNITEGKEALDLPYPEGEEYDHVIYCSSGNGMWKPPGKPAWKKLVNNIQDLDPAKVVVVLVGTDQIWGSNVQYTGHNKSFSRRSRNFCICRACGLLRSRTS